MARKRQIKKHEIPRTELEDMREYDRGVELNTVTQLQLNQTSEGVKVAAFDLETCGLEKTSDILQVTYDLFKNLQLRKVPKLSILL